MLSQYPSKLHAEQIGRAGVCDPVQKNLRRPVFMRVGNLHALAQNSVSGNIVHGVNVIAVMAVHGVLIAGKKGKGKF